MVEYSLEEGNDHRFTLIKEENGVKTEVDKCDRISAEALALEATELGFPVRWLYRDEVLALHQLVIQ